MSAPARTYDLDDLYRLREQDPDPRNRYELIDGELIVSPAPGLHHQRLQFRLTKIIDRATEHHDRVSIFLTPIDLRDADRSVVQPDLLLLLDERTGIETARDIAGPPNLVVEIFSPSTERIDRGKKLAFYARLGADELWLVDGKRRTLSVYSDPVDGRCRSVVTFTTPGSARSATIPGLEVDLDELFAVPAWLAEDAETAED